MHKFNIQIGCLIIIVVFSKIIGSQTDTIVVDTFSTCIKNKLPCEWKKFKQDNGISMQNESDVNYVKVKSANDVQGIGKKFVYNVNEYPFLYWRWRVNKLPQGGQENIKKKNDSAAGVYVFFKNGYPFSKAIKYVWSSTLPIGTMVKSPYSSKTMIFVIESGDKDIGRWLTERRNVLEDYKKAFGSLPPLAQGIAIMTDSDNTHSSALADYDYFLIAHQLQK